MGRAGDVGINGDFEYLINESSPAKPALDVVSPRVRLFSFTLPAAPPLLARVLPTRGKRLLENSTEAMHVSRGPPPLFNRDGFNGISPEQIGREACRAGGRD